MPDEYSEAPNRWSEVSVEDDGVGVTLYEQGQEADPTVVDETWLTEAELIERRANGDQTTIVLGDASGGGNA